MVPVCLESTEEKDWLLAWDINKGSLVSTFTQVLYFNHSFIGTGTSIPICTL